MNNSGKAELLILIYIINTKVLFFIVIESLVLIYGFPLGDKTRVGL